MPGVITMKPFSVVLPLALSLCLCLVVLTFSSSDTVFYESFEEAWEGRWIVSGKDDYQGVWKHEKSEGHDDHGLLVSEKARKYGIAVDLPETVDPKDGAVILQYDLRLQNGLECGGAYLKFLLPQEAGWTPSQFDNESPYSVMFGPDKCGSTNKVHFIFRHKHPKTGKYVEHHLKYPPTPIIDKLSHVYTAAIYPNNTVKILVDGTEEKSADLLSDDFEPAVIPPQTIPDPEDKKPEDWDERPRIPDSEASKPDDWDEDAPLEIEDLEAVKPEGWLDDEPDEVDDPDAVKPEDWDEEEDGEWEPPKVPNPKCDEAPGCGKWTRPTKSNPAYKGKWYPPMIENPNYKGVWKPREIPNPDYFELDHPNLEPIAAIGIEIWTMQDGILFDNIVVAHDEAVAQEYREKTWKTKFDVEKEKQKLEEAKEDTAGGGLTGIKGKVFELLHHIAEIPQLSTYKPQIIELIEKGEKKPNLTLGILGSAVVIILTVIFKFLFAGKKAATSVSTEKAKKEDISPPDDVTKSKDGPIEESAAENKDLPGEIENEGEEVPSTRQRRTRRDT
ncbi:hypothetical protein O6H91_22G062500 [Diphasiastrum complanatum]|uniref:Uncharacterized protein n=7 Tax=Diphasiastrum complanatum TaxID=34168 RepID=A0ACC2AGD5_DIPCM|nr:hypothetical protein O6H91_22G062500 [Diphasiastrum complanatum]KAJ7516551.1 hypothetical protein O6H91_22G062500 [Diphasiastrum complanatum]KAJ7516552.1 hypothetical protein O6H91_22G062500 [Diphasiastrum complanatum]KAJ7516553.1 hypothetical protein O6H91_22G062500 [Diphasiastrum complanatum]KAJ7516554.1 hypothetical protein O6H91_22G062500 [Diphasiastrum complanatum]